MAATITHVGSVAKIKITGTTPPGDPTPVVVVLPFPAPIAVVATPGEKWTEIQTIAKLKVTGNPFLVQSLGQWGCGIAPVLPGDANGDGIVDGADIGAIVAGGGAAIGETLANWGAIVSDVGGSSPVAVGVGVPLSQGSAGQSTLNMTTAPPLRASMSYTGLAYFIAAFEIGPSCTYDLDVTLLLAQAPPA